MVAALILVKLSKRRLYNNPMKLRLPFVIFFSIFLYFAYPAYPVAVEVGTIHSIKGETHTATLYLETFYYGDYESNRLKEYFKGNRATGAESVRVEESLRVAYVGMSRPTHLLCVAIHEYHVASYIDDIPNDRWEKIKI